MAVNRVEVAYDYVVVGGGTAGCTVAARLAERGARVVILEAGGSDRSVWVRIPAGVVRLVGNPRYDWSYSAEPDPTLSNPPEPWTAGRVLGGTSSINGMVFVRGPAADYDAWVAAGNPGWGYASLLPLFKRLESTPLGDARWRGRDGPVAVQRSAARHRLCDPIVEAMQTCGIPVNDDYNGAAFEGVADAQVSQRRGLRVNSASAFRVGRRGSERLHVVLRATCTRLLFDGDRCAGVEVLVAGQRCEVRATVEVIVSAGAIGSPKLLLLSGIGPARELETLGLAVRADAPSVGRSLMDHPAALLTVGVNCRTYNTDRFSWRALGHLASYVLAREGPIAAPHAQLLAHVRSRPDLAQPDAQIAFYPFSYERSGGAVRMRGSSSMLFSVTTCHSGSHGSVTLQSSNPLVAPRIAHERLGSAADIVTLTSACRLLQRVLATAPMRRYGCEPLEPGPAVSSDADWVEYLRASCVLAYHYAGTCRMGPDNASVVDASLAVRGVRGLRVADNSIMPRLVSGNTAAVAYVIGEKAADLVRPG